MTGTPTVDTYFADQASFWTDIYSRTDVYSAIQQQRRAIALAWVDELGLAAGARVLEVGCGAGLMSVTLAHRGFQLDATDAVPSMVDLARRHATDAGVADRIAFSIQDAHALSFGSRGFDLVIALGVLPWLHTPPQGLREMARVLRPHEGLIASVDNVARLHSRLDPKLSPALAGARHALKRLVKRDGRGAAPPTTMLSLAEFDRLLESVDLVKQDSRTFGYGPFTLLGRPVLPKRAGVSVDRRMQALADGRIPWLARVAAQYIVVARKSA